MNNIHSIVNPLDTTTNGASGSTSTSSSNSASTPSNSLDANSFITLLTTELQAQDPLNPLDPTQFVDQLTDLNSLQQLIQIRTDLDSLAGTTSTPTDGSGTASGDVTGPAAGIGAASATSPSNTIAKLASALGDQNAAQSAATAGPSLSSLQALLNSSVAASPNAAANFYSKLGSLSQLF